MTHELRNNSCGSPLLCIEEFYCAFRGHVSSLTSPIIVNSPTLFFVLRLMVEQAWIYFVFANSMSSAVRVTVQVYLILVDILYIYFMKRERTPFLAFVY